MTIRESEKKRKEILDKISELIKVYSSGNNSLERGIAMANMFLQMKQLCDNDTIFIDEVIKKAKSLEKEDVQHEDKEQEQE